MDFHDSVRSASVSERINFSSEILTETEVGRMNPNEKSNYLYEQYDAALGEQLKRTPSQYVLAELEKNSSEQKAKVVKKADSEYVLRELRNQSDENQSFSRDAPHRPHLVATPVAASMLRSQLDSLDNSVVTPQIVDGKLFFPTHGEADARTAVEGSASNPNVAETSTTPAPVDLSKVKFTYAQLVQLLGQSTCQRLEREFVKQNKLSDAELSHLKTAREAVSELNLTTANSSQTTRTAQEVEPNLLSTRTANSVEPNLLSVYSARSPGVFTKKDGILTAQSPEPNLLSVRTANSLEPNLLSVRTSRSPGEFTKHDGVLTAQPLEPNLLSTRTAQSVEPNLLSVLTARTSESTSAGESNDVTTCQEIQSPTTGVHTALGIATSSGSTQSVMTAHEIRSSQDVTTALEMLSDLSRSSQDVRTALEIQDEKSQMTI